MMMAGSDKLGESGGVGGAMSLGEAAGKRAKKDRAGSKRFEKPQGFDLEKYDKQAGFTPKQWAQQFEKRRLVRDMLEDRTKANPVFLKDWACSVIEDPLKVFPFDVGILADQLARQSGIERPPYYRRNVRSVSVGDIRRLAELLPTCAQDGQLLEDVFAEPGSGIDPRKLTVVINLDAQDAQLERELRQLLAVYRQQRNVHEVKRHKKSEANTPFENFQRTAEDWIKNRVLPYLDLTLYCQHEGIKRPTNEELAELLFSDDPEGVPKDRIAKTVKPHADRGLDGESIMHLMSFRDEGATQES